MKSRRKRLSKLDATKNISKTDLTCFNSTRLRSRGGKKRRRTAEANRPEAVLSID